MDDVDLDDGQLAATVGQQLRAAREAAGMSLDELATTTRIPTRHLESLENSEFDKLPAPTYSIGFAKNYAAAVGLDRRAVADQLRAELGGSRPVSHPTDSFEPADPARSFPKWLLLAVLAAVVLVVIGARWLQTREYATDNAVFADTGSAEAAPPAAAAPAPAAALASGPVVLTANEQVWLQVKDGSTVLKEGLLETGQSFEVPATAAAPVLMTGKPEALRISVGTADAPPVGPAATRVSNVSLKPADLLRAPATPAPTPPAAAGQPASR